MKAIPLRFKENNFKLDCLRVATDNSMTYNPETDPHLYHFLNRRKIKSGSEARSR